jgi:hypothetical protein
MMTLTLLLSSFGLLIGTTTGDTHLLGCSHTLLSRVDFADRALCSTTAHMLSSFDTRFVGALSCGSAVLRKHSTHSRPLYRHDYTTRTNEGEQNGCRQRLEGYLSCQQRLALAVS